MMQTVLHTVNRKRPSRMVIAKAAGVIRAGGLVAFPTETVYGLGADGFRRSAVEKIFRAKGRPQDNPLILHVGYKKDADRCAAEIPPAARTLMRVFWPGPLTIILKRNKRVPDCVTASLDTVAIRMPDHAVALSLIRAAGRPLAAPSANTSGRPSPTEAAHVLADLDGAIPMIIDGGRTDIGIESTIIDCTVEPPVILRPGKVTVKQIERHIGIVENYSYTTTEYGMLQPKSPGLKYRHYAPEAPVILVQGEPNAVRRKINVLIRKYHAGNKRVGVLAFHTGHEYRLRTNEPAVHIGSRSAAASRRLFSALRFFDTQDVDIIVAESFPSDDHAIMNRLRKAASEIVSA
jgi:L-threonylcarbamoyladenylate synthase